jgi:PhnB protein
MHFYKDCLGGELIFQTVKDSPMANQWPEKVQDHILHASLIHPGFTLMASDMGANDPAIKSGSISLTLQDKDENLIQKYFDKLSDQGKITHPMHQFYDGSIGALTDKYGHNWLIHCKK